MIGASLSGALPTLSSVDFFLKLSRFDLKDILFVCLLQITLVNLEPGALYEVNVTALSHQNFYSRNTVNIFARTSKKWKTLEVIVFLADRFFIAY